MVKRPNIMLLGILAAGLLMLTGPAGAGAEVNAYWTYKNEEITKARPFSSPAKEAYFQELHELTPELELYCKIETAGYVGPGVHGEITSYADGLSGSKTIECSTMGFSGCSSPTLEALNLPWATELVGPAAGGEIYNKIMPGSKGGKPELQVTCHTALGTQVEYCPMEISSHYLKNSANGAELSYKRPYSEGGYCSPPASWGTTNLAEKEHIEVVYGYYIY